MIRNFFSLDYSSMAGLSILLMVLGSIFSEIWPAFPSWPSGVFGWFAAILLISRLSKIQILQIGILLLIGVFSLSMGIMLDTQPEWLRLLDYNAGLLSMLAAVSFLRLVAMQGREIEVVEPHGMRAYWQTMLAVALFGAFINLSAPVLVADRISEGKKLSLFAAKSIVRAFIGGPTWSPFFAGMAVVLTYVADAHFLVIMAFGFPFAILGLILIIIEANFRYPKEISNFKGYPITPSNLWLPGVLVIGVLLGHTILPHASILSVIALSALSAAFIGLYFFRGFDEAKSQLQQHVLTGLPKMVNELVLFLAAGVLAIGLQTFVTATHMSLPFGDGFDAAAATILLAGMVLLSLIGIHPVISIAVATPLLTPIAPDPQLLAITFVFGWSLGACASPLSGLNLIFQGRYGIPSIKLAVLNWQYVAVMFLVAAIFLYGASIILRI
jgi:hypothetical protein